MLLPDDDDALDENPIPYNNAQQKAVSVRNPTSTFIVYTICEGGRNNRAIRLFQHARRVWSKA
jgi:hypothetical protein